MKKKLLLVMEAIEMNGAVKGWMGYLNAMDRAEWDVDLFLFEHKLHDGLSLPQSVNLLPVDPHCVIERVGFGAALRFAMTHGRIDLAVKRVIYSVLQRCCGLGWKWKLMKPAAAQPKHYDVAIASAQGVSWEYVATKVDAERKFLWVDTDLRHSPWPAYWNHFKKYVDAASGIVCVSRSLRDIMRTDNPQWANKIFVMNYVIDDHTIIEKSKAPTGLPPKQAFRLVTVGRYCQQKGSHLIPGIAGILKRRGLAFEWYVIGPGCLRNLEVIRDGLTKNGVAECVHFQEGTLNPYAIMASADLYVQPSLFEGYGLTVSEALVTGRYVVASDIPQFREQITSQDFGLFSKDISEEEFAEAILTAVEIVQSGKNREDYKTPYSAVETYRQFCGIITSVSPLK